MSGLNEAFAAGSAVVSFIFAGLVFDQWIQRRHSFQLVWAIGLVWYGIGAGAEFMGGVFGWSESLYRLWYLTGAFFVAAYLGAGTVYLLSKTRFGYFAAASVVVGGLFSLLATSKYPGSGLAGSITLAASVAAGLAIAATTATRRDLQGHVTMAALVLGSLVVTALVLTAPVAGPYLDPATQVPVASGFPGYLRVASVPFNAGGGLALVFGALYSAYIYMPKRRVLDARLGLIAIAVNFVASLPGAVVALFNNRLNSRVPATLMIAVGAFIPGTTSSLERFGISWALLLGQFLGVLLIFGGFLVSEEVFRTFRFGLGARRGAES